MKETMIKRVINIIEIIIVLFVIVIAFFYREKIEEYAMTGYLGVFIACFAATSTILLPAPGIFVVIQYAQFLNPSLVVLVGGLGTSLGEMIGYALGRCGKEAININTDNIIIKWFNKKAYVTIFLFSVLPLPLFDVVGIISGINRTNPIYFWLACFIGKLIKMGLYVLLFSYAKDIFPDII